MGEWKEERNKFVERRFLDVLVRQHNIFRRAEIEFTEEFRELMPDYLICIHYDNELVPDISLSAWRETWNSDLSINVVYNRETGEFKIVSEGIYNFDEIDEVLGALRKVIRMKV